MAPIYVRAFREGFMRGLSIPVLLVRDLCLAIWAVLADYATGKRP